MRRWRSTSPTSTIVTARCSSAAEREVGVARSAWTSGPANNCNRGSTSGSSYRSARDRDDLTVPEEIEQPGKVVSTPRTWSLLQLGSPGEDRGASPGKSTGPEEISKRVSQGSTCSATSGRDARSTNGETGR